MLERKINVRVKGNEFILRLGLSLGGGLPGFRLHVKVEPRAILGATGDRRQPAATHASHRRTEDVCTYARLGCSFPP